MNDNTVSRDSYFELSEHNATQFMLFFIIALTAAAFFFISGVLPAMSAFFKSFMQATITKTSQYFGWSILAFPDTAAETEYWFNPLLALFPLIFAVGMIAGVYLTALLPQKIGFMRRKIEREIINFLDRISRIKYGEHTESELREIVDEILTADVRQLHDYAEDYGVSFEELDILRDALKWREGSLVYKILHIQDAIQFYLRVYYTLQYGNAILGWVYVGAAVLIIIIGIRGLKFIPASAPSIILFALSLEFVMLMFYAITVIYSKQDDMPDNQPKMQNAQQPVSALGNAAEVENLLKVFIAKKR
ncbi:MAG: hypothetical protein V4642_05160 [Bacteroidota bacterium]